MAAIGTNLGATGGGSLVSARRCADTAKIAPPLSGVPFSLDVATPRAQGLNCYTTDSPLGLRGRHGWLRGLERHDGIDNIKLQGARMFFLHCVVCSFLEEWKGFTYQSQAEVDQ